MKLYRFKYFAAATIFSCSVLTGCASKPTDIQAQYVSPLGYQSYDCDQISAELRRKSDRVGQLYAELDKTASNDQAQMAVGLLLFWPTLFFLEGGDGPQAAEYARLKGEIDALEQVAIKNKCDTAEFESLREKERKLQESGKQQQEDYDPTNPPS